jgi:UDP-N-acetylglucosamine transferase subunit ALG13
MKNDVKLALVCTQGGHFEQMTNLDDVYKQFQSFWITNKSKQTESYLRDKKKYYIKQAHFTKPITYFRQILPFLKIFKKERPTHIISTGSGRTTFIPFLLSKIFKIKFYHIDTFSRVDGYSKFGEFLLFFGQNILTQWKDEKNKKAIYIGPIFKGTNNFKNLKNSNQVFVTLGTREESFIRLIKAVEELVEKSIINKKVVIQAGHTKYNSKNIKIFDFCTPDEIDEYIINSNYVITQESAGIGTKCLKFNTKLIVMPRDYEHDELPAKSDMKEDLHLKLEEMGFTKVVTNVKELEAAILQIDQIKTGFKFDNQLAIQTLKSLMEEK